LFIVLNMNPGLVVILLVGLVALATGLGLLWQSQQGRVRLADGHTIIRPKDLPGVRRLGSGATLLQFSTEVCAPCRSTAKVLGELADRSDDVAHFELDVTHSAKLAARYHVMQTPTTLILDRDGAVRARIGGAVRRDLISAELDRILVPAA
jgi:thiol-disulfide isomerase/thioredoxin